MKTPYSKAAEGLCVVLLLCGCAILSCSLTTPLPLPIDIFRLIENSISPTIVESGKTVTWTVKVKNLLGQDTIIERCVVGEKATDGWAVGLYEITEELLITNNDVAGASTETIYEKAKPVSNVGPTEIEISNTVTVHFTDGESASDTCIYRILPQ